MAAEKLYLKDTAIVDTSLFLEDETTPIEPQAVTWDVRKPDKSPVTADALPATPTLNQTLLLTTPIGSFSAYDAVQWNGTIWTKVDQGDSTLSGNDATLVIPGRFIDQVGLYRGLARWTIDTGIQKSTDFQFESIDPLADYGDTPLDDVIDLAWMKLEDTYDSLEGGPYLMDRTKNAFGRQKIAKLIPDAIYAINANYQPTTSYDVTSFPYDLHTPLLSQSLLVQSIKHLMRSYVEQYAVAGGGRVNYFDRRDYLNRWQQIFQIENQQFMEWLDLFKKDQMGFGTTSTLVGGYASWYGRYPRYMRGRFPYIYRY